MSGIYIHIPFCRKACHYCNFHFSTSIRLKADLLSALLKEVELSYGFLSDTRLESIYFGGGTPSLMSGEELESILKKLSDYYQWDRSCEITLEVNPEDLNKEYLRMLKRIGVNRLSIGIQSFKDQDLLLMNRAHNASQSKKALDFVTSSEINSFSIDLMFGLVNSTIETWGENIESALSYHPSHISCYNLTIEEQTAFDKWHRQGKIKTPQEDVQFQQFKLAHDMLDAAGYDHYEISNYARDGFIAVHNTNYWKKEKYLGLGPSAHSYNGSERRWNIAHNPKYIKAISEGILPVENEKLGEKEKFNEFIMLSLRTKWGIEKNQLKQFSPNIQAHFLTKISDLIETNVVQTDNERYYLSVDRWYLSDDISSHFFLV